MPAKLIEPLKIHDAERKEIDSILTSANRLTVFDILLTFGAIMQLFKFPRKAIELVKAGFIAIPQKNSYIFGCRKCKLTIGPIPDNLQTSLKVFHQEKSPDCPFFQTSSDEHFDDERNETITAAG